MHTAEKILLPQPLTFGEDYPTAPVAQRRTMQIDPFACVDLGLPISMCDTRLGPGRPHSISRDGSGTCAKASQLVQAMRGHTFLAMHLR